MNARLSSLPLLLLLSATLLAGCTPGRQIEAGFLLADIAAGGRPSWYREHKPAPERTTVSFTVGGRPYAADLYRSPAGSLAPLLLIPGAAEAGKDDPRLIALAESFARARFAVLVPDFPSVRAQQVGAENAREVADAFAWLISRPELAPAGRGGMVAFSYAVGPAILAALDREIAGRVQFVFGVGGYYDLPEVLTFFTTGWFRHQGEWRHQEPNAYGTWVFVLGNLHRIADPKDRELLLAMARRKMKDLAAPVDDLVRRLGPEGRAIYTFLASRDPRRVPLLLRELPPAIRTEIAALDLAGRDLTPLQARLLLVHGYDDTIIPFPQSILLARAVPPEQADLFLVHGLQHVDLRPGPADLWRLWRAIAALLAERDRLARQALLQNSEVRSQNSE